MTDLLLDLRARLKVVEELLTPLIKDSGTLPDEQVVVAVSALAEQALRAGSQDMAENAKSLVAFLGKLTQTSPSEWDRNQISLLLGNVSRAGAQAENAIQSGSGLVEPIAPTAPNPNDRVAIHIQSRAVAAMLLDVLRQQGFTPFLVASMEELFPKAGSKPPAAIVADLSLCIADPDTRAVVQTLREQIVPPPHLFCIGGADDMAARLEAVRLGATRFLARPLDVSRLVAVLRGVTERAPAEPFRVLLVDDDQLQTMLHGAELEDVGLEVLTLNDPLDVPAVVETFRPDVIVIDIYMPGCNGLELAAVLRQDDSLADTPIVFLSAESSIPRQMVALGLGGDDFLTKPIAAEILQAVIIARARRSRAVKRHRDEFARLAGRMESLLTPARNNALTPRWKLDSVQRQLVAPNGVAMKLTAPEVALLGQLFSRPGGQAGRAQLLAALQELPGTCDGRRLEALISRLRRKTVEKCGVKLPLQSEYGRGYSFAGHFQTV